MRKILILFTIVILDPYKGIDYTKPNLYLIGNENNDNVYNYTQTGADLCIKTDFLGVICSKNEDESEEFEQNEE